VINIYARGIQTLRGTWETQNPRADRQAPSRRDFGGGQSVQKSRTRTRGRCLFAALRPVRLDRIDRLDRLDRIGLLINYASID
jgi:hypothetical protein